MTETKWNKKPKKKIKTRLQLVKILDSWFSKFIRLRDSNSKGICKCITCGVEIPRKLMHNCHFIERGNYAVRRDETNCHAGCRGCNTYNQERHKRRYAIYIVEKYGLEHAKALEQKKYEISDIQRDELEEKIEYYKRLVLDNKLYIDNK